MDGEYLSERADGSNKKLTLGSKLSSRKTCISVVFLFSLAVFIVSSAKYFAENESLIYNVLEIAKLLLTTGNENEQFEFVNLLNGKSLEIITSDSKCKNCDFIVLENSDIAINLANEVNQKLFRKPLGC
jgi:hypothetical protein